MTFQERIAKLERTVKDYKKRFCCITASIPQQFDAIVTFDVNANPNTVGTTFDPNTPQLETVLYVSAIDSSQWIWNGTTYVTYVAPISPTPLSSLLPATQTHVINNGNYQQYWNWGTLTYGSAFSMTGGALNNAGSVLLSLSMGTSVGVANATPTTLQAYNTAQNDSATNYAIVAYCVNSTFAGGSVAVAIDAYANSAIARNVGIRARASNNGYAIQVPSLSGAFLMGDTLNTSAIMDIQSTTKGVAPPRMTKTQRNAIGSPVAGLTIYQTDNTPGLRVYNGTNWMKYTESTD